MTARDELRLAVLDHTLETPANAPEADRLIREAIDEAIKSYADVLHFTGRPAPAESGYARDQLIVAFRGGEEDEFCRYGWDTAVMMADRVVASLRAEFSRENAEKIRSAADTDCANDDPRWNGMNEAANLIDPDKGARSDRSD